MSPPHWNTLHLQSTIRACANMGGAHNLNMRFEEKFCELGLASYLKEISTCMARPPSGFAAQRWAPLPSSDGRPATTKGAGL